MYALVVIKGKQYKASKGDVLRVDKIDKEKGEAVEWNSVVMLRGDNEVKIGTPYVSGSTVKARVEDHIKDKKVIIFKYKRRKNYRRKRGHRQQYTLVKIEDITGA